MKHYLAMIVFLIAGAQANAAGDPTVGACTVNGATYPFVAVTRPMMFFNYEAKISNDLVATYYSKMSFAIVPINLDLTYKGALVVRDSKFDDGDNPRLLVVRTTVDGQQIECHAGAPQ